MSIKLTTLLLIVIAGSVVYFFSQETNQGKKYANSPPPAKYAKNVKILDRQPLIREPSELLPANEIIYTSAQKSWQPENNTSPEKELYSNEAPLFASADAPLVAPDLNSTQRRVNFY